MTNSRWWHQGLQRRSRHCRAATSRNSWWGAGCVTPGTCWCSTSQCAASTSGARGLISQALRAYSDDVPVILCSSDPEEVIEVADRTLIMVEGAIVHEGLAADLTAEALAEIMGRSTDMEQATP